ncbi:hypothetical protein EDD29_1023 [Actinocorallia herbida]|uniref:Uncharacterized protein n=1 Tax=Actinocorallia herbida TaxID=58109 RepID=A0A3N1CQC2_9ACTN|nr:hypothetical protein EDD29_1023 [Actinocorallia herbida]
MPNTAARRPRLANEAYGVTDSADPEPFAKITSSRTVRSRRSGTAHQKGNPRPCRSPGLRPAQARRPRAPRTDVPPTITAVTATKDRPRRQLPPAQTPAPRPARERRLRTADGCARLDHLDQIPPPDRRAPRTGAPGSNPGFGPGFRRCATPPHAAGGCARLAPVAEARIPAGAQPASAPQKGVPGLHPVARTRVPAGARAPWSPCGRMGSARSGSRFRTDDDHGSPNLGRGEAQSSGGGGRQTGGPYRLAPGVSAPRAGAPGSNPVAGAGLRQVRERRVRAVVARAGLPRPPRWGAVSGR